MDLFIKNGFSKTTMDDIIHHTGLSKGGVYHHYKNKEEIFSNLIYDAVKFRENIVVNYINKSKDKSNQDILIDMLLEKILDKNPYKSIYVVFLKEYADNPKFEKLYNHIFENSKKEFIEFCNSLNLPEYMKLGDYTFNFFINSLLIGVNSTFDYKNEDILREMLRVMLKAYLDHISLF